MIQWCSFNNTISAYYTTTRFLSVETFHYLSSLDKYIVLLEPLTLKGKKEAGMQHSYIFTYSISREDH